MIKQGKIAVIGSYDSVLAFTSIGIDSFAADNEVMAKDVLRGLIKDGYIVILITDDIAIKITSVLETLKSRTFPVVIPIPSPTSDGSFGLASIKKDVERALGVDILFRDDV